MLKVAICDDVPSICTQLKGIISTHKAASDIFIETFNSGEALCEAVAAGHIYDLIILDIELDQISGVEVAKKLHADLLDECPDILFISGKQGYAMDLFKLRPIDFLLKPLNPEDVLSAINIALNQYSKKLTFCEFKSKKIFHKLPYREIRYFESTNKIVTIHASKQNYECYGRIAEIAVNAPQPDFILIHQSYLIQWRYVRTLKHMCVEMDDGTSLPISQASRKVVKDAYMSLIGMDYIL